jgi:hypothetical protein
MRSPALQGPNPPGPVTANVKLSANGTLRTSMPALSEFDFQSPAVEARSPSLRWRRSCTRKKGVPVKFGSCSRAVEDLLKTANSMDALLRKVRSHVIASPWSASCWPNMASISGFGGDPKFAPSHYSRMPALYCGIAALRFRPWSMKDSAEHLPPRPKRTWNATTAALLLS